MEDNMINTKDTNCRPLVKTSKKVMYYINEDKDTKNEITLGPGEGEFIPLVNIDCDRSVLYIAGASGSGKSTYASKYIKQYKKVFKNNQFFLFSRKPEDKILDELKPVRVPIDAELITDPINITTDFPKKGSLILFDDCNTISDKSLKCAVNDLVFDLLEVGRAYKLNVVITNHLILSNEKIFCRTVLNELTEFVFFPRSGSVKSIVYALSVHFGFDKKQIARILDPTNKTRWCLITKTFPQVCVTEKKCFVI